MEECNIETPEEMEFNREYHTYLVNGISYPSVTEILNPIDKNEYSKIPSYILEKAADRGTAVHRAIELNLKCEVIDIAEEYENYFNAFLRWKERYSPVCIASELLTYHKHLMYAGTIDCVAKIDDKIYIIDFKTNTKINKPRCSLQLEAYSRALISLHPKYDAEGIERAILQVKSNGEYDFMEIGSINTQDWNTFVAFKTIYDFMKREEGGDKNK